MANDKKLSSALAVDVATGLPIYCGIALHSMQKNAPYYMTLLLIIGLARLMALSMTSLASSRVMNTSGSLGLNFNIKTSF